MNPLEKAREAARLKRKAGTLERLDPIQKAIQKPKSLRLAINAKCYDCEGRDADPAVNWRIGNCVVTDCPLYCSRPYQNLYKTPTPKCLIKSTVV